MAKSHGWRRCSAGAPTTWRWLPWPTSWHAPSGPCWPKAGPSTRLSSLPWRKVRCQTFTEHSFNDFSKERKRFIADGRQVGPGRGKPDREGELRVRHSDEDPASGFHQGQQACRLRKQAGYKTASLPRIPDAKITCHSGRRPYKRFPIAPHRTWHGTSYRTTATAAPLKFSDNSLQFRILPALPDQDSH